MQHPIPASMLSEQVEKICGPQAPPQLKQMAAAGMAPLGPTELVMTLYVLAYDPDRQLAAQAAKTLGQMPENVLHGALKRIPNPAPLDGLARMMLRRPAALEQMVLNPAVAPETIVWLAGESRDERLLEMLAANEQRLLAHPEIIERLYNNRACRASTADRAVELAVRNGVELAIPIFAEIKAAILGVGTAEIEETFEDDRAPVDDDEFDAALNRDDWLDLDDALIDEVYDAAEEGAEHEKADQVANLEKSLTNLSVAQKIRVATLGNSMQRAVLVRETNKLVIMAVIKSPALTDAEVVRLATQRTLPEEALRYIAGNREWVKHYSVKKNLVENPRTPVQYSLRFLQHLREADVKQLARSKNIPQAIANAARQLQSKRQR